MYLTAFGSYTAINPDKLTGKEYDKSCEIIVERSDVDEVNFFIKDHKNPDVQLSFKIHP